MTSTLTLHAAPAAGFEAPMAMLRACHERVERMLGLLERLSAHLFAQGCDADARQAARDVMRYFDLAGPAHHEDEERHLLPLLRSQAVADLRELALRLQQDHLAMARHWAQVRVDLDRIERGDWPVDPLPALAAAMSERWAEFTTLYRRHIEAEESQAYPALEPLLDETSLAAMGREMSARRGLK